MNEAPLMTPAAAAEAMGVSTKTLIKWADAGKLTVRRTLGNHRRFSREEIMGLQAPRPVEDVDDE